VIVPGVIASVTWKVMVRVFDALMVSSDRLTVGTVSANVGTMPTIRLESSASDSTTPISLVDIFFLLIDLLGPPWGFFMSP
jgi:putative effector of murein hydrolase